VGSREPVACSATGAMRWMAGDWSPRVLSNAANDAL
jgi:hypothetical protein